MIGSEMTILRDLIKKHQLISFLLITFGISWGIWIPVMAFLANGEWHPLFYIGVFGPFISAIIVTLAAQGNEGLKGWLKTTFRFRISIICYVLAWFIMPIAIGFAQHALYLLLGGSPDFSDIPPLWAYPLWVPIAALVAGGNEEPGWRGFVLPRILTFANPLAGSLLLGIIWAAWHAPLFFSASWGTSESPFYMFLFSVLGLSVIMTWLYYRSRMSVIPVMLFHQATNIIGSYFPTPTALFPGWDDWQILRGGIYWLIAIILIITTRGRLGYPGIPNRARDTK